MPDKFWLEVVSILILNEKMHQNAHNRGVTWLYDAIEPKKIIFLEYLVVFDITDINFKKE